MKNPKSKSILFVIGLTLPLLTASQLIRIDVTKTKSIKPPVNTQTLRTVNQLNDQSLLLATNLTNAKKLTDFQQNEEARLAEEARIKEVQVEETRIAEEARIKEVQLEEARLAEESKPIETPTNPVVLSNGNTAGEIGIYAAKQMEARTGVPATTWEAIIARESNGNPNAVNVSSGAYGLFQLMPIHGNPRTVDEQIEVAANVYHQAAQYFGNGLQPWGF